MDPRATCLLPFPLHNFISTPSRPLFSLPTLSSLLLHPLILLSKNLTAKIEHGQRTRYTDSGTARQNSQIPPGHQSNHAEPTPDSQEHQYVFQIRLRRGRRDGKVGGGDEGEEHHQPEEGEGEEQVYADCAD